MPSNPNNLLQYKQLVQSMNPALYLPLDSEDGITDLSGNGYNGTGAGGITIGGDSSDPLGLNGGSTEFDGTDDYIVSSYGGKRRNLAVRPRPVSDTWWWATALGAGVTDNGSGLNEGSEYTAPSGGPHWRVAATRTSESQGSSLLLLGNSTQRHEVEEGETYTFSFHRLLAQRGDATIMLKMFWYDASGSVIGSFDTLADDSAANGTEGRIGGVKTAPSGAASCRLYYGQEGSLTIGNSFEIYASDFMIEKVASVGTYFDGNGYINSNNEWVESKKQETGWTGTENESISEKGAFANGTVRTFTGWSLINSFESANALVATNGSAPNNYFRIIVLSNENVRLDVAGGSAGSVAWSSWPEIKEWVHWALVFDEKENKASLYINGELVSQESYSIQYAEDIGDFQIGLYAAGGSPFGGKQAHVAVFHRGLNQFEIKQLSMTIKETMKKVSPLLSLGVVSNWKFFLAESDDLEYIADITKEAKSKTLQVSLNRPGNFNCEFNMSSKWFNELIPFRRCIVAEKNNIPIWSGPIWSRQEDWVTGNVGVTASGWFELLMKRIILQEVVLENKSDGEIAFALLNGTNALTLDGKVRSTGITPGKNTSTTLRSVEYEFGAKIGEEIINLTEIEAGMDFDIDPITKKMNIRSWDQFGNLENVVFGYNWGPKNVINLSASLEVDSMFNQYFVNGENTVAESHDSQSVELYGLHQEMLSVSETNDPVTLGAIANSELVVNRNPSIIYSFTPKQNTFSIFEDYNLGDQIYLTARAFNGSITNQAIRFFGASVEITDEGNEIISNLQTTYQGG